MGPLRNPRREKYAILLAKADGRSQLDLYVEAGFKPDRGSAAKVSMAPDVRGRVAELQHRVAAKFEITQEAIVQELAKLAFSNMADYMRFTEDGGAEVDLSRITRDQSAAIQEVIVEQFTDGKGEDARQCRRIKFKLADKRAALVDLGKHLGIFKDEQGNNLTINAAIGLGANRIEIVIIDPAKQGELGGGNGSTKIIEHER